MSFISLCGYRFMDKMSVFNMFGSLDEKMKFLFKA